MNSKYTLKFLVDIWPEPNSRTYDRNKMIYQIRVTYTHPTADHRPTSKNVESGAILGLSSEIKVRKKIL